VRVILDLKFETAILSP